MEKVKSQHITSTGRHIRTTALLALCILLIFKPLKAQQNWYDYAVPATFVTLGFIGVYNTALCDFKEDVNRNLADLRGDNYLHFDDYVQYLPATYFVLGDYVPFGAHRHGFYGRHAGVALLRSRRGFGGLHSGSGHRLSAYVQPAPLAQRRYCRSGRGHTCRQPLVPASAMGEKLVQAQKIDKSGDVATALLRTVLRNGTCVECKVLKRGSIDYFFSRFLIFLSGGKPFAGFRSVFNHSVTSAIAHAKTILGIGVTLLGGTFEPQESLVEILCHTVSGAITGTEVVLCGGKALLSRQTIPFCALGRVLGHAYSLVVAKA